MRLLVLTMLLACTRHGPVKVIENHVAFEPAPPTTSMEYEFWWDRCERLGRTPRYIEYKTPDWGVIFYGC